MLATGKHLKVNLNNLASIGIHCDSFICFYGERGWLGRVAFSAERTFFLIIVGQWPTVLAVGTCTGWVGRIGFSRLSSLFFLHFYWRPLDLY